MRAQSVVADSQRDRRRANVALAVGALACLLGVACGRSAPSDSTGQRIRTDDAQTGAGPAAEAPAGGLSFPLVVEGACPFECCTYGAWLANAVLDVHTEPRLDAQVAFQLEPGERFEAPTGRVIVSAPGLARVEGRVQLYASDGTPGPEVGPGTELTVLEPQAEGFFWVWFDDRRWSTDLGFMDQGRMAGEIVEPSDWRWWVSVRTAAGDTGWITPAAGDVQGHDACA